MLDDVFQEGQDTYPAHLPWVFNREPCGECAESKKGLCRRHWAVHPREVIPFPGLDTDCSLPCIGLWDQYDREEVTPEVEARCSGCPAVVQAWCLQTAVANNEVGLWAGTNSEDRARIRAAEWAGTNEDDRRAIRARQERKVA